LQLNRALKKDNKQQSFYVSSTSGKLFTISGYTVLEIKEHIYDKRNVYISTIPANFINKTTVEIDKAIQEEEFDALCLEKTHEELRLPPEAEIAFSYIQRGDNYDGTKTEYDLFFIENDIIAKKFGNIVNKFPYFDYILPSPFLFFALYSANILPTAATHLFVYYKKDDAFLALYNEGKIVYTKTLNNNLLKIYESFNLHSKQGVDYESFCRILSGAFPDESHEKALKKIEDEIAAEIEEVIIYTKRLFSIGNPNCIYVDSDYGLNDGFYDYLYAYLNIKSQKYDFNYNCNFNAEISHLGMLALLNAKEFQKDLECEHNFTIFLKPKPFHKRDAGHFLIALAASLVLAFSYPAYNYAMKLYMEFENSNLQSTVEALILDFTAKNNQVISLTKQKDFEQYRLNTALKETDRYQTMISGIYADVESYQSKVKTILEISNDILESGVSIKELNIEDMNTSHGGSSIFLEIDAIEHKKITDYIKITANKRKFEVVTDDIFEDKNSSKYTSKVYIKLR